MISRKIYPKRTGRRVLALVAAIGLVSGTLIAGSGVLANVPNADFELEGNTLDEAAAGDDWANLYTGSPAPGANFDAFAFVNDKSGMGGDTTFWTGGGSKDRNDIAQWQFTTGDQSPDKNDIVNAFAAIYRDGNDTLFFGADRFAVNGDAQMGFWFLSNPICLSGLTTGGIVCPSNDPGKFLDPNTGALAHHADGDLLVLVNFNNGGTLGLAGVYRWQGGADGTPVQVLFGTGAECKGAPADSLDFCSTANTTALTGEPVWPYTAKGGTTTYKTSALIEGGLDLDAIPGVAACFPTFIAETRSSSGPSTGLSLDAQLKDLAFGQFELCQPSTSLGASASTTIQPGASTTLSFTETNDGNEDLENVSVTVDNGCTAAFSSGDTNSDGILNEGEAWVFECTVSPTSTTTYTAYGSGTGVDSGILVTGDPTCTATATRVCSAAELAQTTVTVVDARISITPTETNEVGQPHTFTVTVEQDEGTGSFGNVPDGTVVDVTLTDDNGAVSAISSNTCASPGTSGGTCSITFTSATGGTVTGHASVDLTIGGIGVHRETDSTGGNSGDAVKTFVDAYITINPPEDTNTVGDDHTFTVNVFQDSGDGSGFVAVPDGTVVTVLLTDDATSNYELSGSGDTCATGTTGGACTVTFTSPTAGTVTGHASVDLTLAGIPVHRETDGQGQNSGDAIKHFVAGSIAWTKVDNAGNLQGGATFELCKTDDFTLPAGPFVDLDPDECRDVVDNGLNDEDPDAGEFLVSGLSLGRYTVHETVAPDGFVPDPDTETVELTPGATEQTISEAFVNSREVLKITGFGYTNEPVGTPTSGVVHGTATFTVNLHNYGTAAAALTNSSLTVTNATCTGGNTLAITGTIAAGADGGPHTLVCEYNLTDGQVVTADLVVKSTTNNLEREASGSPAQISFTVQAD